MSSRENLDIENGFIDFYLPSISLSGFCADRRTN